MVLIEYHLPESIGLVSIIAMGFACTDVQVCLVPFSVEHIRCMCSLLFIK